MRTKAEADRIFPDAMKVAGGAHWCRCVMYIAVNTRLKIFCDDYVKIKKKWHKNATQKHRMMK
nr:DUF1353 domain-containing protein [Escherichia coli]